MHLRLTAVAVDAARPDRLARFWATLLGWDTCEGTDGTVELRPRDDTGFGLRLVPSPDPKVGQNRMHLDLTSTTNQDQRRTVARALDLGARHVDVGQAPQELHVVLADPEGNEFCVVEAGNAFLAGCGRVGALACDGPRAVGLFWSAVLGWPLVWNSDEQTAIRSPRGGPKISWGGEPPSSRAERDRVRFELAAPDTDRDMNGQSEPDGDTVIAQLRDLGACVREGVSRAGTAVLTDPDGTEFRVTGLR